MTGADVFMGTIILVVALASAGLVLAMLGDVGRGPWATEYDRARARWAARHDAILTELVNLGYSPAEAATKAKERLRKEAQEAEKL